MSPHIQVTLPDLLKTPERSPGQGLFVKTDEKQQKLGTIASLLICLLLWLAVARCISALCAPPPLAILHFLFASVHTF